MRVQLQRKGLPVLQGCGGARAGAVAEVAARLGAAEPQGARGASEKDAKLAQNLGQLQPFTAVFPHECTGQRASFGPQPNTLVAQVLHMRMNPARTAEHLKIVEEARPGARSH